LLISDCGLRIKKRNEIPIRNPISAMSASFPTELCTGQNLADSELARWSGNPAHNELFFFGKFANELYISPRRRARK
jgi:hypothetical protein